MIRTPDPWNAESECAFYDRRIRTERELLALIFAENGIIAEGVRMARAQGIDAYAYLPDDHALAWICACLAPDSGTARRTLHLAERQAMLPVGTAAAICESWYWSPADLTRTASDLSRLIAAEREARLLMRRYHGLLAGAITPTATRTETRAA